MFESETLNQREIYKIVENITCGEYHNELDFLKNLVEEVVNFSDFHITGGRIWQFIPDDQSYIIKYQYGNVMKIPDNYTLYIKDQPILENLYEKRTSLNHENDPVLKSKGIFVYSVTGTGEIIKTESGKYYKFVLGFNADEILQSFYETLNIISSVATITMRSIGIGTEEHKKMQRDIIKASEIQRNLLPEHYVEFYDYKIYGVCIPDSAVGGDYFDYLHNNADEEERIGIVISDAASKGLPAAIQALFVSGAIRMAQAFSPKISTLFSRLNTLIYDTFPYERFVTLFYCELMPTSNRLVLYANAGHCSPIYYRVNKDEVYLLEPTGGLLGLVEQQKFNVENIVMRPGDILALFTDGINEAQDGDGNNYGEARIIELLKKYKDLSAKEITLLIIEDVQKFAAKGKYNDDRTLIIIKRDS
ncbi:MAG: PP2C family protein-serine/threonine phosphatase [Candidatus Kapaibacterium sp.]|jgi:sigma-B regulation protein RsbU (phosphoserine phosphatase)|nr:PP2C family protein-serine/threonine phosphatase [Candidatus Kapabacteria bacterium]